MDGLDCAALPLDAAPELWARLSWTSDLWLFAYGAGLWAPAFPYCEAVPALLRGHHRRFCVRTVGGRLALGLDRGGACQGVAYRVPAVDVPAALAAIGPRAMRSRAFRLEEVGLEFPVGRARALAFVADPAHRDYVGTLSPEETARLLAETERSELGRLAALDPALRRLERLAKVHRAGWRNAA